MRGVCGANVFVGKGEGPDITVPQVIAEKDLLAGGATSTTAVDGTGWIPINLASIAGGSPIARLPLDPVYKVDDVGDVTDDDLLYLYGCDTDTTYELNANLESNQFSSGGDDDRESSDGGNNSNILEVGTKLTILGTSGFGGGGGGGDYKVFVTSVTYTGDLVGTAQSPPINSGCSGGLDCADAICQYHANNAGLGSVSWKAWISDSIWSPSTRFVAFPSPIYLVDDVTRIADDWADLIDGNIINPINKNETGGAVGDDVWTTTDWDGTPYMSSSPIEHCNNWTSGSVPDRSEVMGDTAFTDGWWTKRWEPGWCQLLNHLYCFSQAPL